jgi:hypothetical protein
VQWTSQVQCLTRVKQGGINKSVADSPQRAIGAGGLKD